jgi:hypothetical protein
MGVEQHQIRAVWWLWKNFPVPVLLLHYNARPHSAAAAANLWNYWGWEILPPSSHSSELVLSEFHLFQKMKRHLRSESFHSNDDVQNVVK